MSKTVRIHGDELTPYEQFISSHPMEAARLKACVAGMAKCSDAEAGWVMQEILNSIYRVAKGKANG